MKNTYKIVMWLLSSNIGKILIGEAIGRGLLTHEEGTVIIMLVCMAED